MDKLSKDNDHYIDATWLTEEPFLDIVPEEKQGLPQPPGIFFQLVGLSFQSLRLPELPAPGNSLSALPPAFCSPLEDIPCGKSETRHLSASLQGR